MVRRSVFRWILTTLALLGAGPASAEAIHFTGQVDQDFPSNSQGVNVIVDNPLPVSGASNPADVAQQQWMTERGWTTGWNIKDIRTSYDPKTDTLSVGVNFFGVAGDADGNGDPGVADPMTTSAGGLDLARLGGRKSITVGLDLKNSGTPTIVAGVPADKAMAGPGLDGFNVAEYRNTQQGIAFSYGNTLADHLGALAFDPSKDHPGFEFTITNFTKFPGFDPTNGFGIRAFAGSPDDVVAGEDYIPPTHIPLAQTVPEPATLLAWAAVVGTAAWRSRRRV